MFRRLFFENWVSIFTLIAFITSASIYVSFALRAVCMRRVQIKQLSDLPLAQDSSDLFRHDA